MAGWIAMFSPIGCSKDATLILLNNLWLCVLENFPQGNPWFSLIFCGVRKMPQIVNFGEAEKIASGLQCCEQVERHFW